MYAVSIKELVFTTIWGVVAVCAIGFIIIPHWSAVCFVGPLIVMLYFDLLGIMQFCGIYINAVTYVTVVISIGLLVRSKVKNCLVTTDHVNVRLSRLTLSCF